MRIAGSLSLLLALTLLETAAGSARPAEPPSSARADGVQELILANGMRFLLVERPERASVAAGWVARSGSAREPAGKSGLTHFLEHLLFKGTATLRTPNELRLYYAEAGARGLNALTLQDMTLFFVTVPAEKLELWFWLESDRLLQPVFRELESEKAIVAEERRQRTDSRPTGNADETLRERHWAGHPYGTPVLGWPREVERLTDADARGYFSEHYVAGNLTAALVGRFDAARVRALAERYFGRLPRREAPTPPTRTPLASASEQRVTLPCDCRPHLEVLYRTPAFSHADTAALEILVGLLNGRTGRLYRSLVLDQGLATSASALQTAMREQGALSFTAEAKGETSLEGLLAAWERELGRLTAEPLAEAELHKVKNQIAADAYRSIEDPSAMMMRLLMFDALGSWRAVAGNVERALAVTDADVKRVITTYLRPERRTVGLYQRQ